MKYPKIIAELERTQWAITPEALRGILKAVDQGLTADDYELFHKTEALSDFDKFEPMIVDDRGILVINGPIIPRANALSNASGIVAIDQLTRDFKAFEANDKVKEIAFLIDSPGGGVTGISDFASLIKASSKSTKSFIIGQAASAAYWIASAADRIISTDTGQVGSIGIVLTSKSDEDGERIIVSAQSPDKRPDLDTKEGLAVIQKVVNEIADVFVETVAENRNVSVDTVLKDFGRGGLVVAKSALKTGMIDEISTINEFMAEAKSRKDYEITAQAQQRQGRSEIQTLIFKKSNFPTRESATKWARDHNFRTDKVDETENSWRLRQQDPGKYESFRTGKPLAPGVTPVFGILRRQKAEQTQPALAGERTQHMTLAEFLAENPAAKAEVEALKTEAFNAGQAALRKEVIRIATLMECKGYNDKFREKALLALKGERTLEAIETLADYLDVQIEESNSQIAQEESAELPETPPIGEKPSTNGEIANPLDVQAYWDLFKANRSESEVQ